VDVPYGSISPVHISALLGKTASLSLLLERGGDPDAKDANNCMPLHYAAYNGSVQCMELLLTKVMMLGCCSRRFLVKFLSLE
jgi:ankyrin repeat protein